MHLVFNLASGSLSFPSFFLFFLVFACYWFFYLVYLVLVVVCDLDASFLKKGNLNSLWLACVSTMVALYFLVGEED